MGQGKIFTERVELDHWQKNFKGRIFAFYRSINHRIYAGDGVLNQGHFQNTGYLHNKGHGISAMAFVL